MSQLVPKFFTATVLIATCTSAAFAQSTPANVQLGPMLAQNMPASAPASAPAAACTPHSDPYKDYNCLDDYLGSGVFERLYNYYKLEYGQAGPPVDPNAPASRVDGWPATPVTIPPMPFTEWPYGGTTSLGVTRTASVDSPLMVALANTGFGHFLTDTGIQIYGWVDPGFNVSSNSVRPGGNAPISYAYTPNVAQLDQFVVYVDRLPDTVQKDHVDWGFRLSAIYGENYRYTTSYGVASYQLLKKNYVNGYDFPMVYGEVYFPQVLEGLMIRAGRYISVPDIEAQLAPNNYMYTHSLTYSFDNYTNEGIIGTLALTKNLSVQLGISDGTEAALWNSGVKLNNQDPNPLYLGATFKKDPGVQPTLTACLRYTWNDGNDDINPCANGINTGQYGYNNLQWYGVTYYHKWDDHWHISMEFYNEHQNNVPNNQNPDVQGYIANGGTPFSPQFIPFNAPNAAHCKSTTKLDCTASATGFVTYLNYSPDPLNNISLRGEVYADPQGQRTGTAATYYEVTLGWQHWLSPQIEFRPEVGYYRSAGAKAFNAQTADYTWLGAGDVIFHF